MIQQILPRGRMLETVFLSKSVPMDAICPQHAWTVTAG